MYSAYKSKESLGASVAKKMCFQRSSRRIEGESRPPKYGWKVIPQSRTGSRETPVAKFVVCSWHDQLPDVVGMRSQRATTSIREKMTVVSEIRGSSIPASDSHVSTIPVVDTCLITGHFGELSFQYRYRQATHSNQSKSTQNQNKAAHKKKDNTSILPHVKRQNPVKTSI